MRPGPSLARPPSLILIVIDTLRVDPLEEAGEAAGTMPHLRALAAKGAWFEEATAPAPWTLPSLTSLLTGLLPSVHACFSETGEPTLSASSSTFAEILQNGYGYDTTAFVGTAWIARLRSVFQGFDRVVPDFALQGTEAMVGPWAKARDPRKPFFLVLHTYEAHDPYGAANHPFPRSVAEAAVGGSDPIDALGPNPSARDLAVLFLTDMRTRASLFRRHMDSQAANVTRYFGQGFEEEGRPAEVSRTLRKAYYDGVRWVDGNLSRTIDLLRGWGLLENALLVVTADHGEAFGEHGILMHGRRLYDELVRVPLVMAGPPPFDGGRVVKGAMGLVDVLPTFLEMAGMAPLTGIEGRSVLERARSGGAGHPVLSEEWVTPAKSGTETHEYLGSVRTERWKYVLTYDVRAGKVREEIYDLEVDPGEQTDLVRSTGRVAGLPLDEAFCDALERVRGHVWDAADARARSEDGVGAVSSVGPRPPRVSPAPGPR